MGFHVDAFIETTCCTFFGRNYTHLKPERKLPFPSPSVAPAQPPLLPRIPSAPSKPPFLPREPIRFAPSSPASPPSPFPSNPFAPSPYPLEYVLPTFAVSHNVTNETVTIYEAAMLELAPVLGTAMRNVTLAIISSPTDNHTDVFSALDAVGYFYEEFPEPCCLCGASKSDHVCIVTNEFAEEPHGDENLVPYFLGHEMLHAWQREMYISYLGLSDEYQLHMSAPFWWVEGLANAFGCQFLSDTTPEYPHVLTEQVENMTYDSSPYTHSPSTDEWYATWLVVTFGTDAVLHLLPEAWFSHAPLHTDWNDEWKRGFEDVLGKSFEATVDRFNEWKAESVGVSSPSRWYGDALVWN